MSTFFEFLLELLLGFLQALVEGLPGPVRGLFCSAILGALLGGLSLLAFPQAIIPHDGPWRVLNVVVTPLAAGLGWSLFCTWLAGLGESRLRIVFLAQGYLFALGAALVRLCAAA